MTFDEKRVAPRKDIKHPVKFQIDGKDTWSVAYLINQSASGILIAANEAPDIGSTIHVLMDSDTSWSGDACRLECAVVRVIEDKEDALLNYDLGCIIKTNIKI